MNVRSIRFRLTAWYAAILSVTFCVIGVATYLAIRESIHDTVDADLRARAKGVNRYLTGQLPDATPAAIAEELGETADLGSHFRITDSAGQLVFETPQPPRRRHVRSLSAPLALAGRAYTIQVSTPIDEYDEMLRDFVVTMLWASPLLLLLASAGGYWMSRRALAPVDRITATAQAIGAQNLSERLPVPPTGDELERLSATLNAMFERLEASFERVTRFTADASHELRTPVSVIRTTAELARNRPRTEAEYVKALEQIHAESERTSALIENLMLLARADAGADRFELEPVDLAECLRDACREGRVLAEAKHLRFEVALPSGACSAAGDFQALRRLFIILADNAVKYTPPEGSVTVTLSRESGSSIVEFRDTGIGISPEDLPHIFERFYRADKARSRASGGAGLGLSIAQSIATRHGGGILVDSVPGQGSTFRVRLPFRAFS